MTTEEREALIAQGWTPPVAVDPDLAETYQFLGWEDEQGAILAALKHGREIERAEAEPGMVWKKWGGSTTRPSDAHSYVWIKNKQGTFIYHARDVAWSSVTHYAIITPPAEGVA